MTDKRCAGGHTVQGPGEGGQKTKYGIVVLKETRNFLDALKTFVLEL